MDLGLDIEWICSARTDTLDEETISAMAPAGCNKIFLGIETGSQRIQKIINKNLDISEVKDAIKLLDKYGMEMQVNFIYGLPTEDEDDLLKSLKLIRFCVEEISIKVAMIHKCMCFPSTHIYFTQKNNLVFNEENFNLFEYPAKNHLNFIKNYPNLFSILFTIDNKLINKYFYLDIFIDYVYNFFYI